MGRVRDLDKLLKRHDLKGLVQVVVGETLFLGWTVWLWWRSGLTIVLVMVAISIGASILAAAAVRRRARRQRAAR